MKITRRQLRKLIIEHMTKPRIPSLPVGSEDEVLSKLDLHARYPDKMSRNQADSLAAAFDYPEDRSYSDDLQLYDAEERFSKAMIDMYHMGGLYADSFDFDDPEDPVPEGLMHRVALLDAASDICNDFKNEEIVKKLIANFAKGANDFDREKLASLGETPDEYSPYKPEQIASSITRYEDNKDYSDLYL